MSILDDLLTYPRFGGGLRRYSCYMAALIDARRAAGRSADSGVRCTTEHSASWLAVLGYLAWFDLVGATLRTWQQPAEAPTCIERAIEQFAPEVSADDSLTIYALRCALSHDYSLINNPRYRDGKLRHDSRHDKMRHLFIVDRGHPLVKGPRQRWDGTFPAPSGFAYQTKVGFGALGDLVEDIHSAILESHRAGTLRSAIPDDELSVRYFAHASL